MPQSGSILVVGGEAYTYRTLEEVQELKAARERLLAEGKEALAAALEEELVHTALLIPARSERKE